MFYHECFFGRMAFFTNYFFLVYIFFYTAFFDILWGGLIFYDC